MISASEVEERLDRLTTDLLLPLRAEKRVVRDRLNDLCALVADGRAEGFFAGEIETRLAGKFWFVFCAMLAEADYAQDPNSILNEAWRYQEELRRAFGPTFS